MPSSSRREGGVSLTTGYTDGVLILIVEDTGTGMTEDEQQRVFGAFERLSNCRRKGRLRAGLAIVHNIVTMLHGTIRLDSDKGNGSRFIVKIPMQKAEDVPKKRDTDLYPAKGQKPQCCRHRQ